MEMKQEQIDTATQQEEEEEVKEKVVVLASQHEATKRTVDIIPFQYGSPYFLSAKDVDMQTPMWVVRFYNSFGLPASGKLTSAVQITTGVSEPCHSDRGFKSNFLRNTFLSDSKK